MSSRIRGESSRHGAPFAESAVSVSRLPGSVVEIRSTIEPSVGPATTLHWLRGWAESTPTATLLSEVVDGERRYYGYRDVWNRVVDATRGLLEWGIRPGDRVVVVALNGLDHFVVGHAAMLLGAIYAPVATQYLGSASSVSKIAAVLEMVTPSVLFVPDAALAQNVPAGHRVLTAVPHPTSVDSQSQSDFVRSRFAALATGDPAKLLLTSGSTGSPKAVVYSHRMLVANVQITADVWRFVRDHPPVLVEWLPWNHAFGGNANLNMVLLGGGTIHVDDSYGRPAEIGRSIAAIRALKPTFYAAVPAGFQSLLPYLRADDELAHAILGRPDALFSAGASMPEATLSELRALSSRVRETPIPVLTGWGSTEVGPGATIVHSSDSPPGWIGPPLPGVAIRLVPVGDKFELRVAGESVTPGYWGQPALTAAAFDEDGFYRSGDAGMLADPEHPERGLRFDGRIANDFKLANGSWVNVDRLREELMAAAGSAVRDVVILGPDRPRLAAWFWLWDGADVDVDAVLADHNSRTSGQTNVISSGWVIDFPIDDDLLSPKLLIKAGPFRAAHSTRIDNHYSAHTITESA